VERTLIIFKPDSVMRGLVGEILHRFERAGIKIVGMKMLAPSHDHFYHHYETIGTMITRRGEAQFNVQVAHMQESPVIAAVLEGVEVVSVVRKMVGTTSAKDAAPGTIRGDYAHASLDYVNMHNVALPTLLHASGNVEEAQKEIAHWFKPEEIYDGYHTVHEVFTQPRPKKK
jgi:nucleoside-diphosphate kinase